MPTFAIENGTLKGTQTRDVTIPAANGKHGIRLNGVTIIDERDGNMSNNIYEMKQDHAKKTEVAKLLVGRQITYPAKLEAGKWYTLVVETVSDEMRVTLDGKPAAY